MGKVITCIDIKDVERFSNWADVNKLSSKEDVATFINTFEKSNIFGYNIIKVISDGKSYIFVVDKDEMSYDFSEKLLEYCNNGGLHNITVNNAKLICPLTLSRSFYEEDDTRSNTSEEYVDTGEILVNTDSEEATTGFMDEEDLPEDIVQMNISKMLIHVASGSKLPINDAHGIIIGRSSAQSEFTVLNSRVSRKHARVYKQGNKYMVHDFDSANGTYVDGLRVRSDLDREIPLGSTLMLGDEEFRLV